MEPVGDNGFCERHGGRERLEAQWAEKAAREAERTRAQEFVPIGQAVPAGGGLSQFGPKKRLSREEREAREKRRKANRDARLLAQPSGKKGSRAETKDKNNKRGGKKSGKQAR